MTRTVMAMPPTAVAMRAIITTKTETRTTVGDERLDTGVVSCTLGETDDWLLDETVDCTLEETTV